MDKIFYVAIRLGNDAFGHTPERAATADEMRPEVTRILETLVRHLRLVSRHGRGIGDDPLVPDAPVRLLDINGNTVGFAGVCADVHDERTFEILEGLADAD